MYRDLVVDETRRLAVVIAKMLGLKATVTDVEYAQEFSKVLQSEYNTELEKLLELTEEDFAATLQTTGYDAEKLNALSQMLYVFAEPFKADNETQLLLKKVLIVFDLLEQKHQFQYFDNIEKRKIIFQYFQKHE